MGDEKQSGWMTGLLTILIVAGIGAAASAHSCQYRYEVHCEERCHPMQVETVAPISGCTCAEAK